MTETITRLRQTLMLLEKEALHPDAVAHRLFPQNASLSIAELQGLLATSANASI